MNFGPLNFIFSTPFDGISSREQRTGQNNSPLFLFLFLKNSFFIQIFHSLHGHGVKSYHTITRIDCCSLSRHNHLVSKEVRMFLPTRHIALQISQSETCTGKDTLFEVIGKVAKNL